MASGDADAQEEAAEGLRVYRSDFSSFLAGANPHLEADALEALLAEHTDHLVEQVTAYQDYAAAYETLRQAYSHTELLAAGPGGAIADQFPQQFPDTAMLNRVASHASGQANPQQPMRSAHSLSTGPGPSRHLWITR